jgi:hypothetical protein
MSRTDVHRPWEVQANDPYERHRWYRYDGTKLPTYQTCGCQLCTWQFGRKLGRKQERVLWRKVRQDIVKLRDYEDVDVGPLVGSAMG